MEMTPKLKQAVKEYKNGKAESFETLYKESEKYIYTCIYKVMSGNNNAVDMTNEIMQNTYLQIFLNMSQLENEDRFLSWAGTIATRECFAYIKKNKRYVLLNEDDDTFENLSDSDDIIPEEVMQNQEKRKLVRKIIDTQLTEVQKICIYEYYYNNRKQTEIAELYEMPLNTVKTNLARAKAKVEEGVLDLEKKDGIRLHSFAPFFVLLFTEDVMAATVPAEVGGGVLSTVADASAKAAEAGASATVSGATTTSTVSTVGTTTTVASKVAMLGKIAAASTKAKIIMAVATVSVVGTVGGGVMVASQNGFFTDAPIINEQQENGDNQEADENLFETEIEEIQSTEAQTEIDSTEESDENETTIETVNLEDGGTRGIETPHGNGLSDYEIWHTNSSNGAAIHYIVRNVMSNAALYNADNGTQAQLNLLNESTNYEGFKLYVCPQGPIETGLINLKNMSDEEVGKTAYHTYEILYRTETEVMSTALVKYSKEWFTCYDYYVNDYTTGQSWWYMIHATESFSSQETIEGIINNIEVLD